MPGQDWSRLVAKLECIDIIAMMKFQILTENYDISKHIQKIIQYLFTKDIDIMS